MKDIISKRLDELVDSVLDMDYTKNKRVQSREMGIPYPTFIKYYNGTSECSATNLIKIAEYYNVSVDYLLGRTDVKTLDMDISGCCKLTGLSEAAAKKIIEFSSKKSYRAYTDLLSLFIENPNMEYFLNLLEGYITSGNDTDDKQLGMSRFNYSTKDVALLAINNTIKLMLSQITIPFLSNCTPTEILLIKVILPRLKEDYQTAIQNNKMTPEEAENKISDLENEIEELNKKYQSIIQELKNGGSNNG